MKGKPNFPPMFFWEFHYDKINWEESSAMVVQRILERGYEEQWQELIRFYGMERIIKNLQEKITYLPDECITEVSAFFGIKEEEMLSYQRKQGRPKLWL
jgi:hypothetical protein